MFTKRQVEKILRLNGIEPADPEEHIRSVLMKASWNENDVTAALYILRENKQTHETHIDTLHKVFHTDDRLQPETIKALLGVDMKIDNLDSEFLARRAQAHGFYNTTQVAQIIFASMFISAILILIITWSFRIGIFHETWQW